jgi:hypothetical protein
MNRCSCGREKCTYPECDDGPLPVPIWNRVHTAAALANLANEIAKLQDRVQKLEQIITERTADS